MEKEALIITGVSGRIGKRAAEFFAPSYRVIGLDLYPPQLDFGQIEFFQVDISNKEQIVQAFQKLKELGVQKIASCIHLAAYYNFEGGSWDQYEKITIQGTDHLLQALESFTVDQFLFSSTILVHTPSKPGEKISENSPICATWEYPRSKILTEELIENRRKGKQVILRIAGVYDDGCHSIPISQQIYRIYNKKLESHFFPGDLSQGSAFLHMEDLIAAIGKVVKVRASLRDREVFVVGEEGVLSYGQLQATLGKELHGKQWWTLEIPKWLAKCGVAFKQRLPFVKKSFIQMWMIDLADAHYELDITKARRKLEWEPKYRLVDQIPKMVKKLKENPEKWLQEHGIGTGVAEKMEI